MSSDFQKALHSFQSASKRSAERQRLFVERAKATIETESAGSLGLGSRYDSAALPRLHIRL